MTVTLEAEFDGVGVAEFQFEPGFRLPPIEPQNPYVAIMLDGGLTKSFAARSFPLDRAMGVTIPEGALHWAAMGAGGARVMCVGVTNEGNANLFRSVRVTQDRAPFGIAQRLAAELRARDAAAPMAVEACALELLTAVARIELPRESRRTPAWLERVRDLLHEPCPPPPGTIAREVGVNASHLSRVFRRHYGVSMADYVRRTRLDRAAVALATTLRPISDVSAEAGYSSQAHFTRAFRRHTGVPPGAYRALMRGP